MAYNSLLNTRNTIYVPAAAIQPRVTNGCAALTNTETTTGSPDVQYLAFDGSADEFSQFNIGMPKRWDYGTITFQPLWTGLATGSGTTIWGLQAVHIPDDGVMDTSYGTAQTSTDTFIVVEDLHEGPVSSAITIAGTPADGGGVFFQLYRSGSTDTRTADSVLIGIRIFFNSDVEDDK